MAKFAIFSLLIAGLVVAFSGNQSSTYYNESPGEVSKALRTTGLPVHLMGDGVQSERVTQPDASTVIIAALGQQREEMFRFVVTLDPEGEGTKVTVDIRAPEGRNKVRFESARGTPGHASGLAMLRPIMLEHIDSAIKGRPYDVTNHNPAAKAMLPPEARREFEAGAYANMEANNRRMQAGAPELNAFYAGDLRDWNE